MSRIDDLLAQMTLDEKISMLAGADLWHTVPVPRLGIPAIKVTDGPNGARGAWGDMGSTSALFPVGMALGATWNTELLGKVGAALADEVKAKGAHILLAPTVNIHRTPIAGRNFECYSEDPYQSGKMATAYIEGIQSNGTGACIKHFVCNDQEFERNSISSEIQERPLREIYLEPFRLAIRDAKPWSVMSAYNRINGVFASENGYTLKTILKEEWGFDGIVMSDWFGTYTDGVPGGGLDLEMPGPARWMSAEKVKAALERGDLTDDALNDKIRRLLLTIERAGAFANPELQKERSEDKPEHRALIREAAREAIVLLKNNDNLLPLNIKKIRKIAVIGELAKWANVMGGGSSRVSAHYVVPALEGIRARVGNQVQVGFEIGCIVHKKAPAPDLDTLTTMDGKRGLTLEIYDNLDFSGNPAYTEVTDRLHLDWFGDSVPNVTQGRFSVRLRGFFTPQESGLHTFALSSVGLSRLILDGDILIDNWTQNVPSIEIPAQKKLKAGQKVSFTVEFKWKGDHRSRFLRIGYRPPHHADPIANAVELAKRSDVVILVAGLTSDWESEGFDRINMDLPGRQNELIEKVAAANPSTVVVLNAGSAVTMPWVDQVAAVVEQWYNSQECGNALADVLFGDVNPSGKLPTTFPIRLEDNPAYINYPGENGKVLYGEGLFIGYRYYDKRNIAPLFPFGHGLSYTAFDYSNLRLSANQIALDGMLEVSIDVTNVGKRTGKEVVQLYVHDVESKLVRPQKELKAFEKLELQSDETRTVTFKLDKEAFWYYNPARGGWVVEPGEFEVLIGASSRDIRLRASLSVGHVAKSGARLNTRTPLRELLADKRGRAVLKKHFGRRINHPLLEMGMNMSLEQIAPYVPRILTNEKLKAVAEDLAAE